MTVLVTWSAMTSIVNNQQCVWPVAILDEIGDNSVESRLQSLSRAWCCQLFDYGMIVKQLLKDITKIFHFLLGAQVAAALIPI